MTYMRLNPSTETESYTDASVFTAGSDFNIRSGAAVQAYRIGSIAIFNFAVQPKAAYSSGTVSVGKLAQRLRPVQYSNVVVLKTSNTGLVMLDIDAGGNISFNAASFPIESGATLWCRFMLLVGNG